MSGFWDAIGPFAFVLLMGLVGLADLTIEAILTRIGFYK